jgi:hypothetical protein
MRNKKDILFGDMKDNDDRAEVLKRSGKRMMYLAYLPNGDCIDADSLSSGVIRSNKYNCIYCGKSVGYVSNCERYDSHFRHGNFESCLTNNEERERKEREVRMVLSNRMSRYRSWWYNVFSSKYRQRCIKECIISSSEETDIVSSGDLSIVEPTSGRLFEAHPTGGRRTFADIYIDDKTNINFEMDNGGLMVCKEYDSMVMEFQYSSLSPSTVDVKCEIYGSLEGLVMFWFCDILRVDKVIKRYTSLTIDYHELRLYSGQPIGLSRVLEYSILNNYEKFIVILDNGDYLYRITSASLDRGYLRGSRISKHKYLDQLFKDECLVDSSSNLYDSSDTIVEEHQIANCAYREMFSDVLDRSYIVDLDVLIRYIDRQGLYELSLNDIVSKYHSVVHFLVMCVSYISGKDECVLAGLHKWLEYLRPEYVRSSVTTFGKYKGMKVIDLPSSYVIWVIEKSDVVLKGNKIRKDPYKALYDSYMVNVRRSFMSNLSSGRVERLKVFLSGVGVPPPSGGKARGFAP